MNSRWRGKKRWPSHTRIEPLRALLAIEAKLDSCQQRGTPPTEREMSIMLGLCRSSIETLRRAGTQQHTLKRWIHPTGTKRPKK